MKINLSGEMVSLGRNTMAGRYTPEEIEYIINHGPYPPEVMREYMSGWLSDAFKSVGKSITSAAKSVGSFGKSMVQTWQKAPLPLKIISLIPSALPATIAATAIKTAIVPNSPVKNNAIEKANQQQFIKERDAELARLETERIALLKKQEEQKAALAAQAAAAVQAQPVAAIPAASTASTANLGKILAIGSLALLPLLFGEK